MSDEDRPSAVARARRAKRAAGAGRLDGGAVAVGLLCALVAFVPAVLFALPGWATAGLVGAGLLLGGFVAAYVLPREGCAICHAGAVGLTFYTIVAAVLASTALAPATPASDGAIAPAEPPTAALAHVLATDVRVLGAVAAAGLVLAAVGAWLGADGGAD